MPLRMPGNRSLPAEPLSLGERGAQSGGEGVVPHGDTKGAYWITGIEKIKSKISIEKYHPPII